MTNSNGQFNPHPLANPFNTRLGYSNYSLNPAGKSYQCNAFNSECKSLPDPVMYTDMQDNLHVPDTSPAMNLPDIQQIVDDYEYQHTWHNEDIYKMPSHNMQELSRKDLEYWNKANQETIKLSSEMSKEQKEMLAQLDKMFPPSRLEDEM